MTVLDLFGKQRKAKSLLNGCGMTRMLASLLRRAKVLGRYSVKSKSYLPSQARGTLVRGDTPNAAIVREAAIRIDAERLVRRSSAFSNSLIAG